MAHHKRGRAKNRRAGCLMCKPHKMNHAKADLRLSIADRRRELLGLAGEAVRRMDLRRNEDVDEWAARLAADVAGAND